MIINKITNLTYIGETRQDLYERWRQHKQQRDLFGNMNNIKVL